MEYDIAEILEVRDTPTFLRIMQAEFEDKVGQERFFRITGTPSSLGTLSADLEDERLSHLLENPPNPHQRWEGWDVRPLPPFRRNALGFQNDSYNFHHVKFIKNGHLEFWTAIDAFFCWQQNEREMAVHPRLYPYAVVEHPVSFARLYRALMELLGITGAVVFQMQFVNVRGAILLPYRPESIGFMHPVETVRPLERDRLVFESKTVGWDFDPDPTALAIISRLYDAFGYGRRHIPFFDEAGQCEL